MNKLLILLLICLSLAIDISSSAPDLTPYLLKSYSNNSARTLEIIAGEVLPTLSLAILDNSGKWLKADYTSVNLTEGFIGVVASAITTDEIGIIYVAPALLQSSSWSWTTGNAVFMGASGVMSQTKTETADYNIRRLGYAVGGDKLFFNPSEEWIEL